MTLHEFKLPDIGEGLSEGEIVRWHVQAGDHVEEDQDLVDMETDKAVVEIPAPIAGIVKTLAGVVGDIVKVGGVLAVFETESDTEGPSTKTPEPETKFTKPTRKKERAPPSRTLASPATRKLALELEVDLTRISGTGGGGKITREDVQHAATETGSGEPTQRRLSSEDSVVPLRGLRRQIATSMTESWQNIPHVFDFKEIDATQLMQTRESLQEEYAGVVKLTYLPFLVKAVAATLVHHPNFNASIDMEREEIIYHQSINIGFATATPDGLIVPVIKHANTKALPEIAKDIEVLAEQARTRKVSVEQLSRGTFTISNFGSYGARLGTPIIRSPEVAIAGFGRIQDVVVPIDGAPAVRPILPMVISMDHRVNDGEHLGAFTASLTAYLTDPIQLLAVS